MNCNKTNKTNIYFFQTLSRLLSLIKPQFVKCKGIFLQLFLSRTYGNSSTCTHFRRIKNVSRRTVVVHDGCRAVLLLIKPTGFCRSRCVVVVVVVDLKVPQYCVHDIVYLFQLFIELFHFLKNLCVTRFNFGKIL